LGDRAEPPLRRAHPARGHDRARLRGHPGRPPLPRLRARALAAPPAVRRSDLAELVSTAVDHRGDLIRNIKGIRVSQDLFDDLAADAADAAVAVAAETATRIPSPAGLITRPFDYGTVITYPFVPANWQSTRFSDGLAYGVWYGSLELLTTVYETVFHWHR